MADLELDAWPVGELTTERLVLRESREVDRDGLIAMLTSEDVYRYLGGAMSRGEAEVAVQPPYGTRPASFVIRERASGEFVGGVSVKRNDRTEPLVRPADRPGLSAAAGVLGQGVCAGGGRRRTALAAERRTGRAGGRRDADDQ